MLEWLRSLMTKKNTPVQSSSKSKVILYRYADILGTTLGRMKVGDKWFYTVEDSWRDNNVQVSCIPEGIYRCVAHNWERSEEFIYDRVWRLTKVEGRTGILIHWGNTHVNTMGCILVGQTLGQINGMPAVLNSRLAIDELRGILGQRPFDIEITNIWSKL